MSTSTPSPGPNTTTMFSLAWDHSTWSFALTVSFWLVLGISIFFGLLILWRWWAGSFSFRSFEIDQAELGVGSSKFRFRPNLADRQVAYAIWVELSTRKIGLPIDFDHDVIIEIYDSWYNYFSVTRDLIKSVPASNIKRDSTQAIIKLSIEVLNEGLRPHLTRWQARFRRWYERELNRYDKAEGTEVLDPQQIQAKFPQFDALRDDMERVNKSLIRYRSKMRELILKD